MKVSVADIVALCPKCGETEFAAEGDSMRPQQLRCTKCGAETTRAQLLQQIGEEAFHRAADGLTRLRNERRTSRKSS